MSTSTTTRTAAKERQTRRQRRADLSAAHAITAARRAQQAATRKATLVPLAGRNVDPRDLVATLVHGVASQALTAEQLVDTLHVSEWEVPRERILALVGAAVDRLSLIADLDAGNVDVRALSSLPDSYPENDHALAVRDVADSELADAITTLARRDHLYRRGDVVLPPASQAARRDLDAEYIGNHLGAELLVGQLSSTEKAHAVGLDGVYAALHPATVGVWRTWRTSEELRDWARAYGIIVVGLPGPNECNATLVLPCDVAEFAPLTLGGVPA